CRCLVYVLVRVCCCYSCLLFRAAVSSSSYSLSLHAALPILVIDANRRTGSAGSIPEVSDGTEVPGNQNLGEAERRARVEQLFKPYHAAVSRMIEAKLAAGQRPLLIFLHSFTPVMDGFQRPWEVGILWNEDRRLAGPLIEALRARGVRTGDNEP